MHSSIGASVRTFPLCARLKTVQLPGACSSSAGPCDVILLPVRCVSTPAWLNLLERGSADRKEQTLSAFLKDFMFASRKYAEPQGSVGEEKSARGNLCTQIIKLCSQIIKLPCR